MRTKLFAVYAVVSLALLAAGPGLAAADEAGNTELAVSVNQSADGVPTVSVTDNGTGVTGANVTVAALENATYAGEGNYTTTNGTVDLPIPEANVSVDVTAAFENATAATTANLTAPAENESENETETESFGAEVSAFVNSLLSGDASGGIGHQVATFVLANNPGNAPDHAGPPAWLTGEDGDDNENETEDDRRGPPAWAGDEDDDDGNETDDDEGENETEDDRRGPPAWAGDGEDDEDDGEESETETDEDAEESETEADEADEEADDDEEEDDDDDDDEEGDEDGERGPPPWAGPP
jgi:hypothetical protein